jgi:hypothetical protein
MKKIALVLALSTIMISCIKKEETPKVVEIVEKFEFFGDSITKEGAINKDELLAKYKTLKEGDTIELKFRSKINSVCQKKGCWMKMDLGSEEENFVKFKDYEFFMPLNSTGSEAIVNGKAFLNVQSVNDLKHYAKDAGKSQEAIDSIVAPKITYGFVSNGVLIKS